MNMICAWRLSVRPKRNGYSLLELIIVVAIILVLATIAVPRFSSAAKTAKVAKVQTDIRTIANAAALYSIEEGSYPGSISELVSTDGQEGYLQFEPVTPAGEAYTIDKTTGVVTGVFDEKTYTSADKPEVKKKDQADL